MKRLAIRREHTSSRQTEVMQRETERVAQRVNECPFLVGVLRSVRLRATETIVVDHGLGVQAAWFVIRNNYDGSGDVPHIASAATAVQNTVDQRVQHVIYSDIDGLVDFWFYPAASEAVPR